MGRWREDSLLPERLGTSVSTATAPAINPLTEWDTWPDAEGTPLVPGDWVLYASSHGITRGTVESINKMQWGTPVTIPGDQCLMDLYLQTKDWQDYKVWQKSVEDGVTTPWATITVVPRKKDGSKNGNRRTIKNLHTIVRQDPPK